MIGGHFRGSTSSVAAASSARRKRAFVCPAGHLERLAADLSTVDRMLIIGWRATEQHFLKMLTTHLTGIRRFVIACGGDEARNASARLLQGLGGIRGHFDNDNDLGFSDLVSQTTIEELLRL